MNNTSTDFVEPNRSEIECLFMSLKEDVNTLKECFNQQTFSTMEAADYLKIPKATFDAKCKEIPKSVIGKRNVYRRADLDAYLDKHRIARESALPPYAKNKKGDK